MEQTEKRILLVAGTLMLGFFLLLLYAAQGLNIALPTCVLDVKPFDKGEVIIRSPEKYEIHYVARMWYFDPMEVEVPTNVDIELYLSSSDVVHGFQIVGTNVNLMAVPGTVNAAKLRFKKPGDYQVLCHEYCGLGHQNMSAVIKVRERSAL